MTVRDLAGVSVQGFGELTAGSQLVFEDAGEHDLKGVPGPWRLYRVVSGGASEALNSAS